MTPAPIALGAMRLSTEEDRDDDRSIAVLHAAFEAGVTLVDTADAYCHDATETGHNERLIGRALDTWRGDRSRIIVATKGGLTRPNGLWIPDGRAKHLVSACDASRRALGITRLPLYQLHAPDPRVPLATSVRALDALRRDGAIEGIGLGNVNVAQIEEARAITEIAAVQVALSLWHDEHILNGVLEYCFTHQIQLLAHRPLGGAQRRRQILTSPILAGIAAKHGATPFEIALAWVNALSPSIVAIPGATRVASVHSIVRARAITLTRDDHAALEEHFPSPRAFTFRQRSRDASPPKRDGEVVLVMGLPGAGKSTFARTFADRGYDRLNRDEAGGSLASLMPAFDVLITAGHARLVLDNTYLTRRSRAVVAQAAWRHDLPIRCAWLTTSVDDAQVNAASRIVSRYGRLLTPEEMRRERTHDVAAFPPSVIFRCQRDIEPPDASEGFSIIERVPFGRVSDPAFANAALIVWCDGILARSLGGHRTPASPDDVDVDSTCANVLRRYHAEGWRLLAMSWQPGVSEGTRGAADVDAIFARVRDLAGVPIEFEYCPHAAGPPICWCRKPLPGLGVVFIQRHRLDPARCLYVGEGPHDAAFARKLGFQFREAGAFFEVQ